MSKMLDLDRNKTIKPMLSKTQIKTQGFVQMNYDGAGLYIKLFIKFNYKDSLQNSRDLYFFQHPGQQKDQDSA